MFILFEKRKYIILNIFYNLYINFNEKNNFFKYITLLNFKR